MKLHKNELNMIEIGIFGRCLQYVPIFHFFLSPHLYGPFRDLFSSIFMNFFQKKKMKIYL